MVNTRPLCLPLQPLPVARPWGGRRVARRFGWRPGPDVVPGGGGDAAGGPIGEWWLASTYPGAVSPLRGHDMDLGQWLAGPGAVLRRRADSFPLLVKFLDTDQVLSLQVHPSDEVARHQGLPRGKTEAWYVLEAEPEAGVYVGTADGVKVADLLDRVEAGADDAAVRAALRFVPLQTGDTLLVDAGTVHAVGPGLTLYEVQQNSDTTWRIHDWGRGRDVHLARAREAAVDHPPPQVLRRKPRGDEWTPLIRGTAFALWHARPGYELELTPAADFAVVTVLAGHGEAVSHDEAIPLTAGDTLLVIGEATLLGDDLDLLCVEPPR